MAPQEKKTFEFAAAELPVLRRWITNRPVYIDRGEGYLRMIMTPERMNSLMLFQARGVRPDWLPDSTHGAATAICIGLDVKYDEDGVIMYKVEYLTPTRGEGALRLPECLMAGADDAQMEEFEALIRALNSDL